MTKAPHLTIGLPVYDGERYLAESVERDSRVRYIRHPWTSAARPTTGAWLAAKAG